MKNAKFHFAKNPKLTGKILRVEPAVVSGKKTELAIVSFDNTNAATPMRWKCERNPSVAGYKLTELVIRK